MKTIDTTTFKGHQKRVFLAAIWMLFCSFFSFTQTVDLGGEVTFLNYSIQDQDPIFLGSVTLDLIASSSAIKAYVSANYTENPSKTTMPSLEKAYVKMKLPFLFDKNMRLNVGKMPLAWGYGQVFNAGDLVFGALPSSFTSTSSSESSSSSTATLDNLRSDTEWILNASIPLVANLCNFEPLAVTPMYQNSDSFIDENRVGARLFFTPYFAQLETFELGYLTNTALDAQQMYVALDGSYLIDYTLSATITITDFTVTSDDTKNSFALSNGLQKIINFTNYETGKTHALTLKTEGLWYPYAQNIFIFAYTSFGVTDTISTGLTLYSTIQNLKPTTGLNSVQTTNTLSASCTLTPINGLDFGLSTGLADISEPTKNWSTSLYATYSF